MNIYDVIVIGGGPAGMNAALILARCRRKILLFDTARQRNRHSQGMHNYLTRDGILPRDFIHISQKDLRKYGVQVKLIEITNALKKDNGSFLVKDKNGNKYTTKKLLIATGLNDRIPVIQNIEEFYGRSVFHCPYCDAWEVRDKRLGVYARNKNGFDLAIALLTWSRSVTYFSDGRQSLKPGQEEILHDHGIDVVRTRVKLLKGVAGKLKSLLLANDEKRDLDALFFVNGYTQQSNLVTELGCRLSSKNVVITNSNQQTNIPGVYVAGDASHDMHFVVVAAAEGAKAAVTINKELQKEERLNREA